MKHIKKAISYSVAGSLGMTVIASLSGCEQSQQPLNEFSNQGSEAQTQSYFMVIEQTGNSPAAYKVVEKHPTSGATRAILRDMNGIERFLSEEELKKIAEEEAAKVEAGTSRLTQDGAQMHGGGMSMGETILAAAAGSLVGGMLANRLMGNSNFRGNQQRYGGGRPASSYSQSAKPGGGKTQARSGFFGGNKSGSSSSGSRFSSFGG